MKENEKPFSIRAEIDIKENKPFLIHDYFSSLTPHMGPNVGVIHFFEPVGGGAECALNTGNKNQ